jgi:hypothetical protein
VRVYDDQNPIITCPASITREIDEGQTSVVIDYNMATATDNRGMDFVTVTLVSGISTGSAFPVAVSTLLFEAKDDSGNVDTCTTTVSVQSIVNDGKNSCLGKCNGAGGNCWCDPSCITSGDCCADFGEYCPLSPTVPSSGSSSASTSCQNHCGKASGTCWCDNMCAETNDCCSDYGTLCQPTPAATAIPTPADSSASESAPNSGLSCKGNCGTMAKSQAKICWCEDSCKRLGDCCADFESECGAVPSRQIFGRCLGHCGVKAEDCFCDAACEGKADCCPDFEAACKVGAPAADSIPDNESCKDKCNGYTGACFCDDGCKANGDCCVDISSWC